MGEGKNRAYGKPHCPEVQLYHRTWAYSRAAQKVDQDLPVDHKGFAGRSHDITLKIYNQNYKGKYL